jgi:hypothetical protein
MLFTRSLVRRLKPAQLTLVQYQTTTAAKKTEPIVYSATK